MKNKFVTKTYLINLFVPFSFETAHRRTRIIQPVCIRIIHVYA